MWKFWQWPKRIKYLESALNDDRGMVQYMARHGFEVGYKMNGGGDDWREKWMNSPTRSRLIEYGYLTGKDTYR